MYFYRTNEAQLWIPEDWRDQSVNIFTSSSTDPSDCSFVVSREKCPEDLTLQGYASQQLGLLKRSLSLFVLVQQVDTLIGKKSAIEVEYTWISNGKRMHQQSLCVFHKSQVLTLTGTAPDDLYEQYRPTIQNMLYGVFLEE